MKKKDVIIFEDVSEAAIYAINIWDNIARQEIRQKGFFTVLLSGGKTPIPFYKMLAEEISSSLWLKTHIFFADERFVASTHKDSNYSMIRRGLLKAIDIPRDNVHRMAIQKKSPDMAACIYEKETRSFFSLGKTGFPRFDLIILGIGKDGHTASLFPNDAVLKERKRLFAAVDLKRIKYRRVSATLALINKAHNIIFLADSKRKSKVLKKVFNGNVSLPAALVNPGKGRLLFLIF